MASHTFVQGPEQVSVLDWARKAAFGQGPRPAGNYVLEVELRAGTPDPIMLEKTLGTIHQAVEVLEGK